MSYIKPLTDYIDPGNAGGGSVSIPDTWTYVPNKSVPKIFECELCGQKFVGIKNEKLFYQHQYEQHPIIKPIFIIKSEELGQTKKSIYQKLQGNEIEIRNCTRILVNGKFKTEEQLKELLMNQINGFFKIELSNEKYSNSDAYEIEFFISTNETLDAIDNLFTTHFSKQNLTREKISNFIDFVKPLCDNQSNYIDAYVSYLYGVLAKEQSEDIQTTFTEYQNCFNKSIETLKHYKTRKLARSVSAIALLNLNYFDDSELLADSLPDIFNVCRFIKYGDSIKKSSNYNQIPIDWMTEKIIELLDIPSDNLEKLVEVEHLLKSGFVPETDKYKIIVILARKYTQSNHHEKVANLLKKLRSNPDFEKILNNISEMKNG
jgi:predicted transposase